MLQPRDYYRAATYLLGRYGDDAVQRASNRATELHAQGEANLHAIWKVLAATLSEIRVQKAG